MYTIFSGSTMLNWSSDYLSGIFGLKVFKNHEQGK